jgi:hypothetical protein
MGDCRGLISYSHQNAERARAFCKKLSIYKRPGERVEDPSAFRQAQGFQPFDKLSLLEKNPLNGRNNLYDEKYNY